MCLVVRPNFSTTAGVSRAHSFTNATRQSVWTSANAHNSAFKIRMHTWQTNEFGMMCIGINIACLKNKIGRVLVMD